MKKSDLSEIICSILKFYVMVFNLITWSYHALSKVYCADAQEAGNILDLSFGVTDIPGQCPRLWVADPLGTSALSLETPMLPLIEMHNRHWQHIAKSVSHRSNMVSCVCLFEGSYWQLHERRRELALIGRRLWKRPRREMVRCELRWWQFGWKGKRYVQELTRIFWPIDCKG